MSAVATLLLVTVAAADPEVRSTNAWERYQGAHEIAGGLRQRMRYEQALEEL